MAKDDLKLIAYKYPLTDMLHGFFLGSFGFVIFVLLFSSLISGHQAEIMALPGIKSFLISLGVPPTFDSLDALKFNIMIFVMAASSILSSIIVPFAQRNRFIALSADGIRFPSMFFGSLSFRLQRRWDDLERVTMINENALKVFFRSGGTATLDLRRIKVDDTEQILLSTHMRIPKDLQDPGVTAKLAYLDSQSNSSGAFSHTKLWDEEFNSRFCATAFMTLQSGHKLRDEQLEVLEMLSCTTLSAVYLVREKGNSTRRSIVKESVLPDSVSVEGRANALESLKREADMLVKLDHPQIAKLLDLFVENNRTYLEIEYIHGKNLRQVVQEDGPIPERTVLTLLKQMAALLAYLHTQNPPILHRDISPENFMLSKDGTIYLIDFGAANHFIGTATATLVGKQSYIAPEQFQGKATMASDIYGLGSTCHFLLTGIDPTPLSVSHPKSICVDVSDQVDNLVARCTAIDTTTRYASVEAMFTDPAWTEVLQLSG